VKPILVTGATGRVGRQIVEQLVAAGVPVRALSRRPETANLPAAVDLVGGDLTSPESLDAALDSVDVVFLLWTAPPATASAVVDRIARRARRVVFLSSPHRTPHPFFQQPNRMRVFHADLERWIAESGLAFTIVRPGMFASNATMWWASMIRERGVVRWPYGGAETAPIDDRDIAAVAARALSDDRHAGGDYVITGPESISQADQVRVIGEAIGRSIPFEEISPDEFRRSFPPAPVADMLLAAWHATLGHSAFVTSTVAAVTGSPARSFRQWAADHASAFTSTTGPGRPEPASPDTAPASDV
jgi:uncharacterized protein YbjT (DUF2867 family)